MAATLSEPNPRTNGVGSKPGLNTMFVNAVGREHPFNNLVKQSNDEWIKDFGGTFDGTLDANGYVTDHGTATIKSRFIVVDNTVPGNLPTGNWVLTWSGTGSCSIKTTSGITHSTVSSASNRIVYNITDWGDGDDLYIDVPLGSVDVTDIVLCLEEYEGTCGPGEENEFNADWLAIYSLFPGCIRFMNLQATNQQDGWDAWADRKPESYRTYTHGDFDDGTGRHAQPGAPLEVLVRIQNQLGIPGWYCIPHEYDDASVTSMATYLAQNVTPGLKVALEYSNECWNGGFVQESYCQAQGLIEQAATGRFTAQNASYPKWAWAAWRSKQCMDLAETAFAAEGRTAELVRVMGLQVGSAESKKAMDTPVEETYGVDPTEYAYEYHDAATPAFYWGNTSLTETQFSNNGAEDNSGTKDGATKNTVNMSETELFAWWNSILDTYEQNVGTSTSWAWWANEVVTVRGLELLGYEGGHHVTPNTGTIEADARSQAVIALYEDERFGDLMAKGIRVAHELGFGCLCFFVAIQAVNATKGYYGLVPSLSSWPDDQETYQRLRGVRDAFGLNNARGI